MPKTRIFTFAALAMVLLAVALASFGHFLHALIVLGSVVVCGLTLAIIAWRSGIRPVAEPSMLGARFINDVCPYD